ncbi:MAG: hypothetical protein JWL71_4640 [Acidobacteria bacterium]|nr:hypothetical protein [Acidobacteriota bacterium]
MRTFTISALLLAAGLCSAVSASAEEKLCDASSTNCRTTLTALIDHETQGIDVGVWFFKDDRIVTALVNAKKRGVPMRIIMDPRANATYAANGPALDRLSTAGIPMRKRIAGDICHWKLMLFAGQGVVEWSGANFSPTAFVPQDPYKDYEDEVIYFSEQLAPSFMTMFDNIWTNTKEYANYANVPPTLIRNFATAPIDPRLNFPPTNSYQNRLVPLIDKEPAHGWIDVDIYRITLARPVDALIRAASRGVRIRMYLEPREYTNTARPGNKVQMDRLVAAAQQYPGTIEIRNRQHLGLNHQKTTWFHTQHVVVFGTSNWSDASDDNQLEANIFTDKVPGDPLNDFLFDELFKVFDRKWNNTSPVGSIETVAWRTPTLPPPSPGTTCGDHQASNFGGPLPCTYAAPPPPPPPPPPGAATVVVYPAKGVITGSRWQLAADSTAAGGTALWNPNLNQGKVAPALATPASYVETTFSAMADTPYHVWVRLRAQDNSLSNDSVHIQFSDAVTQSKTPQLQIGSATMAEFLLQNGPTGGNDNGWGWTDNGWGVPGELIYFATTGTHTLRIQQREDGVFIDQIVFSPDTYRVNAPGPHNFDNKILPEGTAPPAGSGGSGTCTDPNATNNGGPAPCTYPTPTGPDTTTVVVYPAKGTVTGGNWQVKADATAAGGSAVWNPNANQTKISPALVSPGGYVEAKFEATKGTPYHVWVRMKAEADSFANDSAHIQFSDSVTSANASTQRIGTTSSAEFVLQNGSAGPPVHGWGWTDNGWGAPGDPVYFAATGTHTLRIQQREDGAMVDQIVLSPSTYFTNPPGGRTNDTKILPEANTAPPTPPAPTCTFTLGSASQTPYPPDGGTGSLSITATDQSCQWSATSSQGWLTIDGSAAGTGNGTISYTVQPNTGTTRDASITVGTASLSVTQDPAAAAPPTAACATVTLDAAAKTVGGAEANWVITVTAPNSTCTWTATADSSWLVVKSTTPTAMPVAGSGTVKVRAAANTTGVARSGVFTIDGVSYAVNQLK